MILFANSNYILIFISQYNVMTKTELTTAVLKEIKKTLNPNSKFYTEDLRNAKIALKSKTVAELTRTLSNLTAMNTDKSSFNKTVNREIKKLDKHGMYNVNSMKPGNCLD